MVAERPSSEASREGLHHEYKPNNILLDPDDLGRPVGVLDWAMASVGDPLFDLSISLGYRIQSGDPPATRGLLPSVTTLPGFYTREELMARCAERSGQDLRSGLVPPVAYFKLAIILQRIYAGWVKGQTKARRSANFGQAYASSSVMRTGSPRAVSAPPETSKRTMGRLDERVALVTGASRGIGKATAQRFAREGAKVCLLDIDEDAVQQTAAEIATDGDAFGRRGDVTDRAEVEDAVAETVQKYGRLDILVNNAGVIRDNMFFRMTDDDWDTVMSVHLKGAFNCARAAQKQMVEQQYGRIVNLSSTSAQGNRGQANYATAKAGLQGFTKTLAIELGKFGITVNAVAPGFVATEMTKATAERIGIPFEEFMEARANETPVGRVGQPEDIASAILFFASEEAGFVTGQVLYAAGMPRG